jgi:hypothetical protein
MPSLPSRMISGGPPEIYREFRENLIAIWPNAWGMPDFLIKNLNECRTLEKALAELEASYEHRPKEELAQMIAHAKAEIADRQRTAVAAERGRAPQR